MRRLHSVLICAAALLVQAALVWAEVTITEPFRGVRHAHVKLAEPRLLSIHVVEIDLNAPDIRSRLTPPNGDDVPGETTHQTTREYVAEQGAQLAINAGFFSYAPFPHTVTTGIAASDGVVYSHFPDGNRPWPAINISKDNQVSFVERDPADPERMRTIPAIELYNAVSGSEWIVRDGEVVAAWEELHPRTAIGVTEDNRLILFVVDGRNPGHSLGMTTPEIGRMMIEELGVVNAINLDGGGSTTLVMADPEPRVVNVTVGRGREIGSERANGTNLAVFAAPVEQGRTRPAPRHRPERAEPRQRQQPVPAQ